jgi:hypothetical protein
VWCLYLCTGSVPARASFASLRKTGRMRSPRFLVILAIALLGLVVGASLLPDPDQAPKPRVAATAPAAGTVVVGELPGDEVVRAETGDLLQLTVTAAEPTSVELPAFGEIEVAAPGSPARFSLLVDQPGAFDVRYADGELAGRLQVG